MATAQDVQRLALALPETSERPCYGTPGFYVRKTLFARIREDYETLVVFTDFAERAALAASEPAVFTWTAHYENYPAVLVALPAVEVERLAAILGASWRFKAPARVRAAYPGAGAAPMGGETSTAM